MKDMWDIAAYVEEHPEEHEQRWRLAKKLYAAHEYRHALEHLNVLKNEWTPKLNVRRYLAATYYRLGRYDEAAAELESALNEWPDETGPREQLGHVYQAAGRLEPALDTWNRVLRVQPEHALAKKHVKRINEALAGNEHHAAGAKGTLSDGGIANEPLPMPGFICFNCGARNSDEFESCWQCGQPFQSDEAAYFLKTPPLEAHGPLILQPETLVAAAVVLLLALLAATGWLGVIRVLRYRETAALALVSLADLYDQVLTPSRVATGIVLLLLWPLMLKMLLRLFRASPMPPGMLVYVSGLLLGTIALLFLVLPAALLVVGVAILLFLSLALFLVGFNLGLARALGIWIAQAVLIGGAGLLVFWLTECYMFSAFINPIAETRAIHAYRRAADTRPEAMPRYLPDSVTPIRQPVRWHASGSEWLDVRASRVAFLVRTETDSPPLHFRIYEGPDALRDHQDVPPGQKMTFFYNVKPDTTYHIGVTGSEGVTVQVLIQSALGFTFPDAS